MNHELEPITGIRGRTPEQVVKGLGILVACGGNYTKAAKQAKIAESTLKDDVARFPNHYRKLQEDAGPELVSRTVNFLHGHLQNLNDAQALALE